MFKLFNFTSNQQLDVCTLDANGHFNRTMIKNTHQHGFEMDKATSIMHPEWPT